MSAHEVSHAGRWQVFGLAGTSSLYEDTYWPSLPGTLGCQCV